MLEGLISFALGFLVGAAHLDTLRGGAILRQNLAGEFVPLLCHQLTFHLAST